VIATVQEGARTDQCPVFIAGTLEATNSIDKMLEQHDRIALGSGSKEIRMLSGSCHCGATGWTLTGDPGSVTACNCTLCHRYGALWAYDYEDGRIEIVGSTSSFRRLGKSDPTLEVLFCPACAAVLAWRGLRLEADDRRRMAVNIRLADFDAVGDLLIDHFDGLETFENPPSDGRRVRDLWA
jgi:hypothetical protein